MSHVLATVETLADPLNAPRSDLDPVVAAAIDGQLQRERRDSEMNPGHLALRVEAAA